MYENERLKKEQRHLDDKRRRKELDADAVRIIGRQQVGLASRLARPFASEGGGNPPNPRAYCILSIGIEPMVCG